MKRLGTLSAAAALGALACLSAAGARSPKGGPKLALLAELPVLHEGRVKPLETVARSSLLVLRGKQSISARSRSLSPIEWLLDVLARPQLADEYPTLRVDDPELLSALGLSDASGRYYAFSKLAPSFKTLEDLSGQAESLDPSDRTRVQSAAMSLYGRVVLYQRLKNTLRPAQAEVFAGEAAAAAGGAAALKSGPPLQQRLAGWSFLAQMAVFRPLPPSSGARPDDWRSIGEALLEAHAGAPNPGLLPLSELADAWRAGDAAAFDRALDRHAAFARSAVPRQMRNARWEAAFQRAQPFTLGMTLYLLAGLLVMAGWLMERKSLERAAYAALAGAVAVHTAGLLARMLIEGRPPVTNLYSSAVFVGWVGGLVGLWQERRSGGGLAAAAASVLGFCTLIIAHHLSAQGDTMEMMRAVLDSNFWLTTHVVTITMGYGSAFLAGTLAHVYLLRGALTRSLDKESAKRLVQMTYFAVCLSLFFSFVGTVLGGIWADQSWGRFWGWDPKENGALLIVLWLAIVLHARWGGFVRERGLMAMAVFGNVVTALSWFGVNMLGIGLHSYGFTEGTLLWLGGFILAEFAVMCLAAIPPEHWRSPQVFA